MSLFIAVFQILLVVLSPLLQAALGQLAFRRLSRLCGRPAGEKQYLDPGAAMLLGLLLHLTGIFFLRLVGVWWAPAVVVPLVPLLLARETVHETVVSLKPWINFNFALWFFAVLSLGASLFQAVDGIQTPWANNYGDLTFHLGMITSYVFGENFPPQYHIYPGERLSYPFMVNLWSAALWWPAPTFRALSIIFAFQWTVLWCLVYRFLNGNRYWLAPWALLFGGGCYGVWATYSWELIPKGHPWAVFLTTIWVTQRSALLGVVVLLGAVWCFFQAFDAAEEEPPWQARSMLAAAGLLLGLSPLVHTHSLLAAVGFIGCMLAGRVLIACASRWCSVREWPRLARRDLISLGVFIGAVLPAVIFLPWLLGKSGVISWMWGWAEPYAANQPIWHNLGRSAWMWASNAPAWLILIVIYWMLTLRHLEVVVLIGLFFGANLVKLAYWDWDQLKVFIGLYAITLLLWSREKSAAALRFHFLMVFLMVPAAYESWKILRKGEEFTVYEKTAVAQAEVIRRMTPARAIVAAAPDHNSLITLTGRSLFSGYTGTLWSHGIKFEAREAMLKNLGQLCQCDREREVCPDFLLWTDAERRFWKNANRPRCVHGTGVDYLFQFIPGGG